MIQLRYLIYTETRGIFLGRDEQGTPTFSKDACKYMFKHACTFANIDAANNMAAQCGVTKEQDKYRAVEVIPDHTPTELYASPTACLNMGLPGW